MEIDLFVPRFTAAEEVHRFAIKHTPGKLYLFDRFQKLAAYTQHVPMFYTLLTPLFQIIYGSNNLHGGYYETGDEKWVDAQHNLTRLLARTTGFQPDHHLLEVGSGIGGPAVTMAMATGSRISGLNITPAHIRRAKKHVRYNNLEDKIDFIHGNALKMPIEDGRFDHAYAIESVSHMPGKATVIGEVARVTRPGAYFGIIDACADDVEALNHDPNYNLFNVTWGVRAEEWIRAGEIPEGFKQHGFKLIEERDLSANLEPAPMVQAEYARARKKFIVDLYGDEVFELTIRGLEIASDYIKTRKFSYKMWIGRKED